MRALSTAIFAKCADGTDLYSSLGGRLYKGRAPEGVDYPYAVFSLVSDNHDWNFNEDFEDVLIQVSIFSKQKSTGEIEDLYGNLKDLFDDCTLAVTGYTTIWMQRGNAMLMNEEHTVKDGTAEVWHYAVEYSVLLQKAEATTATEDYITDSDSDFFVDTDSDDYGMRPSI